MSTAVQSREQQLAWERGNRRRVGVAALLGALLSVAGISIALVLQRKEPTTGVVQGLLPALHGTVAHVSQRVAEIRYFDTHGALYIVGAVLSGLSLAALAYVLVFLFDATRYRRPELASWARPTALYGGAALAVIEVVIRIVSTITAHSFLASSDHSVRAADNALGGTPAIVTGVIGQLAALALVVGMVVISLNVQRVGLLTRFMGTLGIIAAVLTVIPIFGPAAPVILIFWLLGVGLLLIERWPYGQPPAWAAGEAIAWPSSAEQRQKATAARQRDKAARRGGRDEPRGEPDRDRDGRGTTPIPRPLPDPEPEPTAAGFATFDEDSPGPPPAAHPASRKRKRRPAR